MAYRQFLHEGHRGSAQQTENSENKIERGEKENLTFMLMRPERRSMFPKSALIRLVLPEPTRPTTAMD